MGKASRRKKTKRSTKPRADKRGPWGFDYGVSVRAAAVGSVNFSKKLTESDIIAVAYGSTYADEVHAMIPSLTLVGRNEFPLQEAFKEFNAWADASDGDAVELTIVFHQSNGYTIIIGANTEKLINRTFRYDAVLEALIFQVYWAKPIDTLSEPLKEMRAFLEFGIRPFKLSAATYSGLTTPGAGMLDLVKPVRGVRDLLKFSARFVNEGSEEEKDWQRIARLAKDRKGRPKQPKEKPELPDAKSIFTSRANRLKTLFPLSLWRAETCGNVGSIMEEVGKLGIRQWQVQQAVCNLLVSREIGTGAPHFIEIAERDWPDALIKRLRTRYESGIGEAQAIKTITLEEILRQVQLDVGYLLSNYGVKAPPTELVSSQKELNRLGFLDASTE
jgi:hypothetical protein